MCQFRRLGILDVAFDLTELSTKTTTTKKAHFFCRELTRYKMFAPSMRGFFFCHIYIFCKTARGVRSIFLALVLHSSLKKKKLSFLPGLLAEDLQVLEMRCVSWEEKNTSYIHVDVNVRLQITGSTR